MSAPPEVWLQDAEQLNIFCRDLTEEYFVGLSPSLYYFTSVSLAELRRLGLVYHGINFKGLECLRITSKRFMQGGRVA
jgi:hypothetical protein